MGWKVVEVETNEYMKLYLNNVLIERKKEKILINITDIDLLIMHNDRASLSVKLMNALTSSNVSVIFMDNKHEPSSFLIPVNGNHMSLKILEKQINWTTRYKGNVWSKVVSNKIINQMSLLARLNKNEKVNYLHGLSLDVKPYDVTNREGHAAKVYWNNLMGKDFRRDQKAESNTVINSMLNYGYSIIRSLMIRSIIKKGLDTRIALFHKSFTNFFALSSDLMEPFRPLIDNIVFEMKDETMFTLEMRDKLISVWETKLLIKGKRHTLSNTMDMVVDGLISGTGWEWVGLWD
ncbi:MAG: type II CRISPR-associated endonuclease Cas1 [Mycoplasmataceae bacterium]|nr:type II CRISPR-associated endonuclease Cas1 [Mycoplasmataceae bacterium]